MVTSMTSGRLICGPNRISATMRCSARDAKPVSGEGIHRLRQGSRTRSRLVRQIHGNDDRPARCTPRLSAPGATCFRGAVEEIERHEARAPMAGPLRCRRRSGLKPLGVDDLRLSLNLAFGLRPDHRLTYIRCRSASPHARGHRRPVVRCLMAETAQADDPLQPLSSVVSSYSQRSWALLAICRRLGRDRRRTPHRSPRADDHAAQPSQSADSRSRVGEPTRVRDQIDEQPIAEAAVLTHSTSQRRSPDPRPQPGHSPGGAYQARST
jgi:hypothetical protein